MASHDSASSVPSPEPAGPERERRVLQIFEASIDLDRERRNEYLQTACSGDGDLRGRVEALLSAHAESSSFIAAAPAGAAGPASEVIDALLQGRPEFVRLLQETDGTAAESPQIPPPIELGGLASDPARYGGREEIARGGMGVVYRIWDTVLRRPLAMKVSLRRRSGSSNDRGSPGDSRQIARFLEEAQITGQLDHPGVVPLHDIGLDSDGRVFFTMRLVQGLDMGTIFSHARERKENWNETRALAILVKVCETLAYAHSKGVIHRDIKPANVMVGRYGEAYVMDWGLAKVVGREDPRDLRLQEPAPDPSGGVPGSVQTARSNPAEIGETSPLVTMDGAVVGTPSFMPPEQAEGRIAEIDARSDVYAVGAMLYMLLAGQMPYTQPGVKTSPRRVLERVRRGPPQLLREVAGDAPAELVSICEKAMARLKSERYATMEGLAEDLRAFLENRVVRAHRTGAAVELRKWVARNRATAASLAALFVFLSIGLGVSLSLLKSVRLERDAKGEALTRAGQEAAAKELALTEKGKALARAEATRLAAQSATLLASDPGGALLHAIEAAKLEPGYRSDSALLAALGALRERRTLLGHGIEVTGALFTLDGRRAVTTARDNTVRIWDTESGEETFRLHGHLWAIEGLVQDQAGKRIASFGWDMMARVWDIETGRFIRELALPKMDPHPNVVYQADFSPDGRRLLTASYDGVGRIWSVATGGVEVPLVGHGPVKLASGVFSPDGHRAVTASHDGTARIWDAASGACLHVLEGHGGALVSAGFSPDGRRVVTASMDDTSKVWDVETGGLLWDLRGHERWLGGASFSPDGRRILTFSNDATARLWDPETGKEIAILRGHEDAINSGCFSADSSRVLTASEDRTARIWDVLTGAELAVLRGHQGAVLAAAFSRDGRRAVTASKDNTARIWDADTEVELAGLKRPAWDRWTIASPDGSRVLVFGTGSTAEIRDAASGDLQVTLAGHEGGVQSAAFSRDGARAATVSLDMTARIWDATSGSRIAKLEGHVRWVICVAFSPDGAIAATGAADHNAAIWEATTGNLLHLLKGHGHVVNAVDFSPDGTLLATASDDKSARIWNVATGALIHPPLDHGTGVLNGVLFSPDGRRLLTASRMNVLFLWDVASGKRVTSFVGHDADFIGAGFESAGKRLVTLHADGAAHVWDPSAGRRLLTVRSPGTLFRAAGFEDDGRTFWTVSVDGARRARPLDPLPVALARSPREPDPYDRVRIDTGSPEDKRGQRFDRFRWHLLRSVAVAERAWENDPSRRDALYTHARGLRELFTWLRTEQAARKAETPPSSSGGIAASPSLAPVLKRGLRIIERTAALPLAPSEFQQALDSIRSESGLGLLTYGSVDDALRILDRAAPIGPEAKWKLLRGVKEPGGSGGNLEWTSPGFDDAAWEEVALPVGYGRAYAQAKTVLDDMRGNYSRIYLRRRFSIDDPRRWRRLRLRIRHDDGYVAFLNGVEILRAAAGKPWEPVPFGAHASRKAAGQPSSNVAPIPTDHLRKGENVIALLGLNLDPGDEDFFLAAEIDGEATSGPERDRGLLARFEPIGAGAADDFPRRYLEGRILQRQERHVEAAKVFEELRAEDPMGLEPICRLVECLRASGRGTQADDLIQKSVDAELTFPDDDLERLKTAGWRFLRLPDQDIEAYYRAFLWAKRAREKDSPRNADRVADLGVAQYRLGLHRAALDTLRAARLMYAFTPGGKSPPRTVAFHAMACHRLGMEEEARKHFLALRDPQETEALGGAPYVFEAAELIGFPRIEEKRP